MESNYLLTYSIPVPYEGIGRINQYAWFDSEIELKDAIGEMRERYDDSFEIIETIKILDSREIEFE